MRLVAGDGGPRVPPTRFSRGANGSTTTAHLYRRCLAELLLPTPTRIQPTRSYEREPSMAQARWGPGCT